YRSARDSAQDRRMPCHDASVRIGDPQGAGARGGRLCKAPHPAGRSSVSGESAKKLFWTLLRMTSCLTVGICHFAPTPNATEFGQGMLVTTWSAIPKPSANEGKGTKDRMVLFGKSFATALRAYLAALRAYLAALRAYLAAHPKNRYLFQTRLAGPFTPRRVEQIVKRYAEAAGVKATPHTFRHQAITWLTRHSGMADAELQLITVHAKRKTLAIY